MIGVGGMASPRLAWLRHLGSPAHLVSEELVDQDKASNLQEVYTLVGETGKHQGNR